MPSISEIETTFSESSIIYDKDGEQIYTFYGGDENRQYVPYESISKNIVNALVAMEDQRFFSNIGFDIIGIIRSAITCSLGGRCSGWSSLSQQLIKNTLLVNESLYRRKFQEIVLSFQLNLKFPKEKILELYLNKISFGSNTYWVEQATRRFFGKPSTDVSILEASIIASLPKTPTGYNPYTKRDRLMGHVYYFDEKSENGTDVVAINSKNAPEAFLYFTESFSKIQFTSSKDELKICGLGIFQGKSPFKKKLTTDCYEIRKDELIEFLNSLQLPYTLVDDQKKSTPVIIEYQAGRKDRVLMRMYEDGYIQDNQFHEAINTWFDYQFKNPKESILYPHFVFYVRDYLVDKYGEDFFQKGGWKIYTTIDSKLQKKAEEIIDSLAESTFKTYGINNGSLVALDTVTRDVVAMVGSQDYFNKDIDGEVNIMTSIKQPWSSMKPFVYARAFEKNRLSTDTPIFDVEMGFWSYKPKNFDWKFLWPMTIRTALNSSRNIPAIKMFYLALNDTEGVAEKEHDLVGYLQWLWLDTITKRDKTNLYWAPIVLGSAEVRWIDFANAYATMASNGSSIPPNPILKIVDPEWNEIEREKETPKQVMVSWSAYMITNILSDNGSRPDGWNYFLALNNGRKAAVKTGTSSKKIGENTHPRDLWTVWYTPQYTTAVWTGNTDGKQASMKASGMESSAIIWKKFMDFAHTDLPKKDFVQPDDVGWSGQFLYLKDRKPEVLKPLLFEKIQIDIFCSGKVSDRTPREAIRDAVVLERAFPIEDNYPNWREPVEKWLDNDASRLFLIEKLWVSEDMILASSLPQEICQRPDEIVPTFQSSLTDNVQLFSGIYPIEITYNSQNQMKEAVIIINDKKYRTINLGNTKSGTVKAEFWISISEWHDQTVEVKVLDIYGYSTWETYNIRVLDSDKTNPVIQSNNESIIRVKSWQNVVISGSINDQSEVSMIQIIVNSEHYGTLQGVSKYNVTLKTPTELSIGKHVIQIQAIDFQRNISSHIHTVYVD